MTTLHFHIGRGGRFNNAGHTSFIGKKTMSELISDCSSQLFVYPENHHDILAKLGDRSNLRNLYLKSDTVGNYDEFTRRTGVEVGEMWYCDCNGDPIIEVNHDETGRLEFDNDYDSDYITDLYDCTPSELLLILNSGYWDAHELIREYFNHHSSEVIKWNKVNEDDFSDMIKDLRVTSYDINTDGVNDWAFDKNCELRNLPRSVNLHKVQQA